MLEWSHQKKGGCMMSNKTVYYGEQDEKMVKEVFKYFKKQRNRNTVNYSNTFLDCMRVFHDLFVESEEQNYQLRLEQLKHMESQIVQLENHIKSLEAQLQYAENSPTSKDELSQKVDQLLKNSNTQGRLINQQLNYLQKVSQFLQNQPQFNKKTNRNDYNRSY